MPIYQGTNQVKKIFLGNQEVKKIYYGTQEVWSAEYIWYRDLVNNQSAINKGYLNGFATNSNTPTYGAYGDGFINVSGNNDVSGIVFVGCGFGWMQQTGTVTTFRNCVFHGSSTNSTSNGFYKGWCANSYVHDLKLCFYSCTFYDNGLEFTAPGTHSNCFAEFYDCTSNQLYKLGYTFATANWSISAINCVWNDTTINTTTWDSINAGADRGVLHPPRA